MLRTLFRKGSLRAIFELSKGVLSKTFGSLYYNTSIDFINGSDFKKKSSLLFLPN